MVRSNYFEVLQRFTQTFSPLYNYNDSNRCFYNCTLAMSVIILLQNTLFITLHIIFTECYRSAR